MSKTFKIVARGEMFAIVEISTGCTVRGDIPTYKLAREILGWIEA